MDAASVNHLPQEATGLNTVDELLDDAVKAGDAVGVSAVVVNGPRISYMGAAGHADGDSRTPMTPDTIMRIASMTKAITSVAAMAQVEQGRLSLDGPIGEILPTFDDAPVLEGFDVNGAPLLRPAKRPVTLRHLLTHTSGLAYPTWNRSLLRYREREPEARPLDGPDLRLSLPLVFDPGDRWEYGTNTDWAGFAVEKVTGARLGECMEAAIFSPLGMNDTAFEPRDRARLSTVYRRREDGTLGAIGPDAFPVPSYDGGGGGLFSTASDYGKFLRALLGAGDYSPVSAQTLATMKRNHIGDLIAGTLPSFEPERSNDVVMFPGTEPRWSLFGLINTRPVAGGRSAGSVCWGGLYNSYFWVDSVNQVAGAIFTQTLPFVDPRIVALYERFEQQVYAGM